MMRQHVKSNFIFYYLRLKILNCTKKMICSRCYNKEITQSVLHVETKCLVTDSFCEAHTQRNKQ